MTAARDADITTEILDRRVEHLLGRKARERLLLLKPFLGALEREPVLAALLQDAHDELQRSLDECREQEQSIRKRLASLWEKYGADVLAEVGDARDGEEFNSYCSLTEFAKQVGIPDPLVAGDSVPRSLKDRHLDNLVAAVGHWAKWARDVAREDKRDSPSGVIAIREALSEVRSDFRVLSRRVHLIVQASSAAAHDRLRRLAEKVNPVPQAADDAKFYIDEGFARFVHDGDAQFSVRPSHGLERVEKHAARLETDLRILSEDLTLRVLTGRSRFALVRRYAARCEAFDAIRLTTLADADSRNAERGLTLDLAGYLFDNGLTPLLDPTVGQLRPDVLDAAKPSLFYAEAKQYVSSPRQTLIKAYRQVWATWGRLRNVYDVREAFIVVFRRDGARVELPPTLRYRGLRLHSVLVDLKIKSGSREAETPVSLREEELLPIDADEPTAKKSHARSNSQKEKSARRKRTTHLKRAQ